MPIIKCLESYTVRTLAGGVVRSPRRLSAVTGGTVPERLAAGCGFIRGNNTSNSQEATSALVSPARGAGARTGKGGRLVFSVVTRTGTGPHAAINRALRLADWVVCSFILTYCTV